MQDEQSLGIIVGRFQVPYLHEGHQHLLKYAFERHNRMSILIGVNPSYIHSDRSPLPFNHVMQMIHEFAKNKFAGEIIFGCVSDCRLDVNWSKILDDKIESVLRERNLESACLYGSRDSFLKVYQGKYPVHEVPAIECVSGTYLRQQAPVYWKINKHSRASLIAQAQLRRPVIFSAVDIAILNQRGDILLCRKKDEEQWQFVGGFIDAADLTIENAAARELKEETSIEIPLHYIGSNQIDDWRYRKTKDKVMTHLYVGTILDDQAYHPADDIHELAWFHIESNDTINLLIPEHHVLWDTLKIHLTLGKVKN